MPFALWTTDLSRRFGRRRQRPALDAVCLDVPQASLVAVIGAAGSGKSTLLRLLAGTDRPSAGTVSHPGIDAHEIGTLLQTDVLSPGQTLAENVAAPLRRRSAIGRAVIDRKSADRLTAHALELLQLTPLAAHLPQDVDAATRQRALLARALAGEPRLLLLDEPFSLQDEAGRASLAQTLRQLHELLGTTTVMATRNAATALPLAGILAVLHEGRLVEAGTPHALYDMPSSPKTAALLGPVNRLAGTVVAMNGDIAGVRLACGPVVEARMPELLVPGLPCTLCIRPERIAIAAAAADMGEDAVQGTVVATRFSGAVTRLHLLIGRGAELIVDRPSAAGLRGLSPGQPAAVAWQPYHAIAYPAGAPA